MINEDPNWYNVHAFLNQYKDEFKPPVSIKSMFNNQLTMIFIKGPNERLDFHLEEGEEIFYMMKGEMNLKVILDNKFRDINIKEGEIFVLPARVRHSPRRHINSFGFVIERKRVKCKEADGLLYYDESNVDCVSDPLHEVYEYIGDNFDKDVRELVKMANYSYSQRDITNKLITRPEQLVVPNENVKITEPLSLESFIKESQNNILSYGHFPVFKHQEQSKIEILSQGEYHCYNTSGDIILWTYKGNAILKKDGKFLEMNTDDVYLLKTKIKAILKVHSDSYVIKMEMAHK